MGLIAVFLVGFAIATVQIVSERVVRAERARIYTLGALAAFFGGSLAKAIEAESVWTLSASSLAGAAVASGVVLYAWRRVALRPEVAAQRR